MSDHPRLMFSRRLISASGRLPSPPVHPLDRQLGVHRERRIVRRDRAEDEEPPSEIALLIDGLFLVTAVADVLVLIL
jgi:hypothetical protein